MTPRAKDSLVSFGERLSTRIFAAYLTRLGVPAQQFDAWGLGLVTSDEFTNAEIDYQRSLPAVQQAMQRHAAAGGGMPIITGFVGKGRETGVSAVQQCLQCSSDTSAAVSITQCCCQECNISHAGTACTQPCLSGHVQ